MLRYYSAASALSASTLAQAACSTMAARLFGTSTCRRGWTWLRAPAAQAVPTAVSHPVATTTAQQHAAVAAVAHLLHPLPFAANGDRAQMTYATEVKSATRLRVAVDIDEVLGRFLFALNQYCQEAHGMKYDLSDYSVYEFHKIWGCSSKEASKIVYEFFKSPLFHEGIPIIPGAADALFRLSCTCDLMVVTSRQHVIQQPTLQWIEEHYAGLFQDVFFGNHWALDNGTVRKKSEICRSIGAHMLIDDNPGYATECAEAGMHVLLYDWEHSYPWSKIPSGSMHPRITVVRNWAEVEETVMAMAPVLLRSEQPSRLKS